MKWKKMKKKNETCKNLPNANFYTLVGRQHPYQAIGNAKVVLKMLKKLVKYPQKSLHVNPIKR